MQQTSATQDEQQLVFNGFRFPLQKHASKKNKENEKEKMIEIWRSGVILNEECLLRGSGNKNRKKHVS